jgi:hypothetical protein
MDPFLQSFREQYCIPDKEWGISPLGADGFVFAGGFFYINTGTLKCIFFR